MDQALIALWLLETTWQSAVLVVVIFVVQLLLRRWLTPAWRCALWGIVAIRLAMPVLPSSDVSLYRSWGTRLQNHGTASPVVQVAPQRNINMEIAPSVAVTAHDPIPPVVPAASSPEESRWPWQTIAISLYLLIAALLLLRRITQMLASRRLRSSAAPCSPTSTISVLESDHVRTPALAGLLHPCILLPRGMAAQLPPQQLDLVLAHELAHLRRRDHWAHAAWSMLQAVHWFNPFVYIAFSRYRLECELACDQAVLARRPEPASRAMYGQMLLDLATSATPMPAAVAMAEGRSHLKARIRQIAATSPGRGSVLAGAITLLLIIICGLTQAQTPPAPLPALSPATQPTTAPAGADDPLERRLPVIRFDGVRLREVVDFLRDTTSLSILMDWEGLKQINVTPDRNVELRLKNVSLRQCLDELCRLPAGRNRMAWVLDGDVITISTIERLRPDDVTKVYDVTDIVRIYGGTGDAGVSERLQDVATLIESTIATDSWKQNGGYATVKLWTKDNQLIISQIPENHIQIEALLNKLRERGALAIHVEMRAIDLSVEQLPAAMADTLKQGKPLAWYPNAKLVAELIERAKAHQGSSDIHAPRMTVLNGATGRVSSWTDVNYVGNIKATTRPSGTPVYEPEIATAKSGLDITATAYASHDRKSIRLQLKHELKRLLGINIVPFKPLADAKESFFIQQPIIDEASFESDVSIENGKTACLGERVVEKPVMVGPGDRKIHTRVFLLLVTPTIIDVTQLPKPRPVTGHVVP